MRALVSALLVVVALAGSGTMSAAAGPGAPQLWFWGDYPDNGSGSCQDPNAGTITPIPVPGLTDIASLAPGQNFVAALKADGTVWAWGGDPYGQLGNGSSDNGAGPGVATPHQVLNLSGVTAIATSPTAQHVLAITQDGSLWAWGDGDFGQLGNDKNVADAPDHEFTSIPFQIPGLSHVTAIGAGDQFSLAVTADGQGWQWGTDYGALGAPYVTSHLTPVPLAGLDGAVSIAGGESFALALKRDGTVWSWGWNNYGQLGLGQSDTTPHPAFAPVPGLSDVVGIAAGRFFGVAVKRDGTVWMWGSGYLGGARTLSAAPVQVSGLPEIAAVAAGGYHTLALDRSGTVWSWGDAEQGQLGHPPCVPNSADPMPNTPAPVEQLTGVTAVAAGFFDSLAVTAQPPLQPVQPHSGCTYFVPTQHNLCGGFQAYWQQFGGLAVFGYPLTDEFQERGVTVQYFERARFEWHPGSNPSRYDVELGLLGDQVTAGRQGRAPFQPAQAATVGDCQYVPQTHHNLCGGFRAYWQQFGGLAVYGYPISEEYQEKNPDTGQLYTVQYFERQRFEWHPGAWPARFDVELGRLGAEVLARSPQ